MSGTSFLVDTNIVLYLFNGDMLVTELLNDNQIYLSFITELELLTFQYMKIEEKRKINSFLSDCTILDITPIIKIQAIAFRKRYSLKLPDAIIAATSHYLNVPLVTADKAFKKIKELDIILIDRE